MGPDGELEMSAETDIDLRWEIGNKIADSLLPQPSEEVGFTVSSRNNSINYIKHELSVSNYPVEQFGDVLEKVLSIQREVDPRLVDLHTVSSLIKVCETPERADLILGLAKKWKEKYLANLDPQMERSRALDFSKLIMDLSGKFTNTRPQIRSEEEIENLFEALLPVYDIYYSRSLDEDSRLEAVELLNGMTSLGIKNFDTEQVRLALEIYDGIEDKSDKVALRNIVDIVTRFGRRGLSEEVKKGFLENLIPAIKRKDPEVSILQKAGNIWGLNGFDYGVGDFLCKVYTAEVTPQNINELLMALRVVPATDQARLEQNRLDGLTLSAPFGILRDFIHDQRPMVNEVVNAMVEFYEDGNRDKLARVLKRTDYLSDDAKIEIILDRQKYDELFDERRADAAQVIKVKPIDILRRLQQNTKPVDEEPPVTNDAKFNDSLSQIVEKPEDKEAFKVAIDFANNKLLNSMHSNEIGTTPNFIKALAWIEQQGFKRLQKLTDVDHETAYREPWFQSLLKFQELTYSADRFDDLDFRIFMKEVEFADTPVDAYRAIVRRETSHIGDLGRKYKDMGKEHWVNALWSGNVAHELIGLTDDR